jgi:SAM-dependent methyltransferase
MNNLIIGKHNMLDNYFKNLEDEGLCSNRINLLFYLENHLFKNIELEGKSLIDIGSGTGVFSFFGAVAGAQRVVCLEPQLEGSNKGNVRKFERLFTKFSLPQIISKKITFQDFNPEGERFDIILLHNSINHLDEEACENLHRSENARKAYEFIFRKCSDMSKKGTKLIIADCSRYNFFSLLKMKNPFARTIEWHKHQSPYFWSRLLKEFGYIDPQIKWTTPGRLQVAGRILLGNPVASYFLKSHFVLTLTKA